MPTCESAPKDPGFYWVTFRHREFEWPEVVRFQSRGFVSRCGIEGYEVPDIVSWGSRVEFQADDIPAWAMGQDPNRCERCGSELIEMDMVEVTDEHIFCPGCDLIPDGLYTAIPVSMAAVLFNGKEELGGVAIVTLDSLDGKNVKLLMGEGYFRGVLHRLGEKWCLSCPGYGKFPFCEAEVSDLCLSASGEFEIVLDW